MKLFVKGLKKLVTAMQWQLFSSMCREYTVFKSERIAVKIHILTAEQKLKRVKHRTVK